MYSFLKRGFDLVVSALAIIVTSPLWLIIAAGIKLSSKGPVFYRAVRVGKDGKPFTMYKFRSMHVYVPEDKDSGKTREGGFIANQQRVFPFGSFLRKSKLDELPQLLNILLSHMSIVGPRPTTVAGAEKRYVGRYSKIMSIKPGLSCLESLYDYAHGELFISDNFQYEKEVLPMKLELSLLYVDARSVWLDLAIIFRTAYLMFAIVLKKQEKFEYTRYEEKARLILQQSI